uniref:Uncharacterized protein n=1 Tax=Arundo donax TaxID=35708 RepID=A0A0A8Z1B3_ARUDO
MSRRTKLSGSSTPTHVQPWVLAFRWE